MNSITIARFTLKEAVRKRFFLLAAIVGVIFLAVYGLGFHFVNEEWQRSGLSAGRTNMFSMTVLLAGLFLIHLLGMLVAIAVTAAAVSQEVDDGTIHLVATKPLARWEIIVGKWLGMAVLLAIYVLGMAWGVMAVGYYVSGVWPALILQPALLMLLAALVFLSLSLLWGSFLPTLANALLLLTMFGIAFFGGMLEQVGAVIQSDSMVNIGIATSLLAPTDVLWRLASKQLAPGISAINAGPFASYTEPSAWMVLYTGLYIIVAVVGATRIFGRRDL